jgi:hypothetical protein
MIGPIRSSAFADEAKRTPKETAAELLKRFDKDWTSLPDRLHMRAVDDGGWKTRMIVLCGLARLGPEAETELIEALDSDRAERRVLAAQGLGFLGGVRSKARLERTLAEEKVAAARLYAADSLGMIGGLETNPLFERIAAGDPNKDVRSHLKFALERKGEAIPERVRADLREYDLTRLETAKVGVPAPDFTLTDVFGQSYRLTDFRGRKGVVLLFIYGDT